MPTLSESRSRLLVSEAGIPVSNWGTANSVEEASMLFETIQNAVGISNSNNGSRPQTLREAVQRPTSLLINSKRNNEATKDPKMDRMLRLAGLTKQ